MYSYPKVPDYLEFISQPMDFSTMRTKLEAHAYCSIADLESDFELMVSNCLKYNSKDTMFHRAALHLREVGGAVLRHAHRQAQSIGLDPSTGMHLPEAPNKHGFYHCSWDDGELGGFVLMRVRLEHFLLSVTHYSHPFSFPCFPPPRLTLSTVDCILDPENRLHLTTDEQLKALLDKLDMVTSMRSSGGRTKRIRLLRREINTLRQKMNQQQHNAHSVNGNDKEEEGKEEEEEQEEKEEQKDRKKGKKDIQDNGPFTSVSDTGTGKRIFTQCVNERLDEITLNSFGIILLLQ